MMRHGWLSAAVGLALVACGSGPQGKKVSDSGSTGFTGTGSNTLTTPGGFAAVDQRIDGAEGLNPDPESSGVQLCALDSGELIAAWSDDRDGTPAVYASASADGGKTWPDDPVKVDDGSGGAVNPVLACGAAVAWLAWEDWRDSDTQRGSIYTASTDDLGLSWSANLRVGGDDDGLFDRIEPVIAVAGNDVHIAWSSDEAGAPDIFVASSNDRGQSYGDPVRLDSGLAGEGWSRNPAIDADGDDVVVAWEDRRNGTTDIYAAHSGDAGVSWSGDQQLDGGNAETFDPAVAVEAGQAYVAWHDQIDGPALEVYGAWSTSGGASFGPPVRYSEGTPGERDSVLPQLVLSAGTLHMSWFQGQNGGYHVMYKQVVDGVEVGPQVQVDHAPDLTQAIYTRLAVRGDNVVIAWRDDRFASIDDRDDLFYAHSTDGGQTWSGTDHRIDSHDDGTTWSAELQIALDDGGVAAAWTDARSGSADVWFIRLELGDESD